MQLVKLLGTSLKTEPSRQNYDRLNKAGQDKDTEPMEYMPAMPRMFGEPRVYRLNGNTEKGEGQKYGSRIG